MPFSWEPGSVSRATLLRLIRDNEATTRHELVDHLLAKPNDPDRKPHYLASLQDMTMVVLHALNDFEEAGLITRDGEKFAPTPLIQKVQLALDINLHDLSLAGSHATLLNPIFGRPKDVTTSDIFVLMPFSDELSPVYQDHIRCAAEDLGISVSRGDDMFAANSIMSDIWQSINNCLLVIADCTGRNPNVFYGVLAVKGRDRMKIFL